MDQPIVQIAHTMRTPILPLPRGQCINGKHCFHITVTNDKFYFCLKQSSLFSIHAVPSR